MKIKNGYEFDDVLIIPKHSTIVSRNDVNTSQEIFLNDGSVLEMKIPIIASPMKEITGKNLVIEMRKLGGIGILHRGFDYESDWLNVVEEINDSAYEFGISVGIGFSKQVLSNILNENENLKIICIDTANGYRQELINYLNELQAIFNDKPVIIMSGNVVTKDGAINLAEVNCNMIRIGIGGGSLCTTRNTTGIGYPQMSALFDTFDYAPYSIADGGIRFAGDMCKALTTADYVMLGGQLATTFESDNESGIVYGMASGKYQQKVKGSHSSIEGIEKQVERTNSLHDFIKEWMNNLASSMSYLGAHDLTQYRVNARYIKTGTGSIDHSKMKPEQFMVKKIK